MKIDWREESLEFLTALYAVKKLTDPQAIYAQCCKLLLKHTHAEKCGLVGLVDPITVHRYWAYPENFLDEQDNINWLTRVTNNSTISNHNNGEGFSRIAIPVMHDDFRGAFVIDCMNLYSEDPGFNAHIDKLSLGLNEAIKLTQTFLDTDALRARFDAILETIPQAVVFIDNNATYAWVNRRAAELLGLQQTHNNPLDIAKAMQKLRNNAENSEDISREGARLFANPDQSIQDWKWIFGNPIERVLSVSSSPVESAKLSGRLWVFADNTNKFLAEEELRRLNLDLDESRIQAERANQAKSEFLSSMSHELRTPMNAILGFSQLMEYNNSVSGEEKENLREIIKAGYHLLNLINEVLDLSKIESGAVDFMLEPVDLYDLVEECVSLVNLQADKSDISISHSVLEGMAVCADRTRLKQALINLLSNAIKYNCEGGSVKIGAVQTDAGNLRIQVADTGNGIPADRLSELFVPFNRLGARNTDIEGTGIGLTITRRLIDMMGGKLEVQSEEGVGSEFCIELPSASLSRHADEAGKTDVANSAAGEGAGSQHVVLYIEDNPSNINLVSQILLRRQRIGLLVANNAERGIELAKLREPELILLDINMPNMDGYQVLEVFKADERTKNIPVIAITANAMPGDIQRGRGAGFDDYLTKPLDIKKFLQVVEGKLSYLSN